MEWGNHDFDDEEKEALEVVQRVSEAS